MLPVSIEKLHGLYKSCNYQICTDSRNILPGSLFFCLKGPAFNGNHFAIEALNKGAAYVVADEMEFVTHEKILFTPDSLGTLQALALQHRKQISTTILAIGGSNGKTTTKELCFAVLGSYFKTKATRANLNNHIGVPLTLLELTGDEDVAIVELGTNHPGEIKILCDITQADIGIVTNIGKEHLEGFGSIEAIAEEEGELYVNLIKNKSKALVNTDDVWLSKLAEKVQNTFSYGITNPADLKGTVIKSMPYLSFALEFQGISYGPYYASIGGEYNLYNILAAISAGIQLGLNPDDCAKSACQYAPQNNRSEWCKIKGKDVWLDAYNANPSSMEVALKSFAMLEGPKAVLLGDMLELGTYAEKEHTAIFKLAKELGFEKIYLSGPEFAKIAGQYELSFFNTQQLVEHLKSNQIKENLMLVKGSRGMKMESVLDVI